MQIELVEDKRAKSKSFFLKRTVDYFDDNLLNFLKKYYKKYKQEKSPLIEESMFNSS